MGDFCPLNPRFRTKYLAIVLWFLGCCGDVVKGQCLVRCSFDTVDF